MKTTPLLLKIFLLAVTSKNSMSFVASERSGFTWESLWNKMNHLDNNVNYKSSCPWHYVKDTATGRWRPQLLQVREKWCRTCCIDLNQSNASHLVINPRGQCSEIRTNLPCNNQFRKTVVGYTCVYALSISTDKRNGEQGPLVNNRSTPEATRQTLRTQYFTKPGDSITTNIKYPSTNNKNENEKNEGQVDKEQHDQYTTVLNQHVVPPFLGNAQFKQPPFLENNNGQFRPGFLNGLNAQIGQPPVIPIFALNEKPENMQRSVKANEKESAAEGVDSDTNAPDRSDKKLDQNGLEEIQEQLPFTENINEPLR